MVHPSHGPSLPVPLSTPANPFECTEQEADGLDRGILWFKIATYALGVAGGMLSFLSLEVAQLVMTASVMTRWPY